MVPLQMSNSLYVVVVVQWEGKLAKKAQRAVLDGAEA